MEYYGVVCECATNLNWGKKIRNKWCQRMVLNI